MVYRCVVRVGWGTVGRL